MGEAVSDELLSTTLDVSGLERAQWLLKRFPVRLFEALRRANMKSSAVVLKKIKSEKLTGQVLNRITGNLIRSWAVIPPVEVSGGWDGGVGSNSAYAAAHEFGVDHAKYVTVNAYTRAENRRSTFAEGARSSLRTRQTRGLASQGVAFVRSFTRYQHTKLPARPYARPSVKETAERRMAIHKDEIRVAWEESK